MPEKYSARWDRANGEQRSRHAEIFSLEHFSIGQDLMPCEIITAYAILKRSPAIANHKGGRLDDGTYDLIVKVRDELLDGQSGTQFNINVNH